MSAISDTNQTFISKTIFRTPSDSDFAHVYVNISCAISLARLGFTNQKRAYSNDRTCKLVVVRRF
jgi:hypothetical protein